MRSTSKWFRFGATAALTFTALALWPLPTLAASGENGGQFRLFLVLVAVVGVAYLVAHVVLERIADRFGIVTGIEYVIFGAIVFRLVVAPILPGGAEMGTTERLDVLFEQLRPVLVLGTGSLGLLWGTHLDVRNRDEFDRAALRPALVVSFSTFLCVAALPAAVAFYLLPIDQFYEFVPALIFAGSVALVAADAPIRTMESFLQARGDAPTVAYRIANVCSSVAIIAFGSLFGFDNAGTLIQEGVIDWIAWLAVHLLVGVTLAGVFGTYLRKDFSDEKILTVVIGMVVFTSGIAHGLSLSPIFVNFVLGVVLVNTSQFGQHVRKMLESIKHPLYIVLFIFAGAHIDPSIPFWAYALAAPYLVLRFAGRWIGGYLAYAPAGSQRSLPNLGRVLFAPGGLSIAMALDFVMIYSDRTGTEEGLFFGTPYDLDAVFAGMVVAIIISEVVAHTMTRDWMIDASDVKTGMPGESGSEPSGQLREGGQ